MRIKYYGNSCFLFKSKIAKLITNPKDDNVKLNLKKADPDVVVTSHKIDVPENDYYLITSPGEYEVKELFVYGYNSSVDTEDPEQADIYMFDIDGVHVGMIDQTVERVRGNILNEMGIVDILCISIRDDVGMKLTKITDLINKIEPYYVIPMDFNKESLEKLAKILGVKNLEEADDLKVKKAEFDSEEVITKILVLK